MLLCAGVYDAAGIDVWAAGVVLYQMLTARMPFCHDTNASGVLDRAMMQRIIRGQCVALRPLFSFGPCVTFCTDVNVPWICQQSVTQHLWHPQHLCRGESSVLTRSGRAEHLMRREARHETGRRS